MNGNTSKAEERNKCAECQFETTEDRLKHVGESHSRGCSKFAEPKNPSEHDPKCHIAKLCNRRHYNDCPPCTCKADKEQADKANAEEMKRIFGLESIASDACGCMTKRENGIVVQAITCKMHLEQ